MSALAPSFALDSSAGLRAGLNLLNALPADLGTHASLMLFNLDNNTNFTDCNKIYFR